MRVKPGMRPPARATLGAMPDDPDEIPRELAEYEPGDGPSVSALSRRRAMRMVAVVSLIALVLPGALVAISTATSTAAAACRLVVGREAPDSIDAQARFELGNDGPGWYCYAVQYGGEETLLRHLGLIPGLLDPPVEDPGQPA